MRLSNNDYWPGGGGGPIRGHWARRKEKECVFAEDSLPLWPCQSGREPFRNGFGGHTKHTQTHIRTHARARTQNAIGTGPMVVVVVVVVVVVAAAES